VALHLAASGFDLLGIDTSETMLERARSYASEKGGNAARIRWEQVDVRAFESTERFGLAIFAFSGFMHLLDHIQQIKALRQIKGLSQTVEGKRHDKKLADEQDLNFPPGSKLWKDTGFQGDEPPAVDTFQPTKKPKGRDLTADERQHNALISSQRIGVEHSIGGVKTFRIVHDVFRNLRAGFDDLVMETACGLHNMRCDHPLTA
jgi:SAM-dependent methyltransferase